MGSGAAPIAAAALITGLFFATGSPCDPSSLKASFASPEACAEQQARRDGTSTWKTSFDEWGEALASFDFAVFDRELIAAQNRAAGRAPPQ
jgi:hypothetical protein